MDMDPFHFFHFILLRRHLLSNSIYNRNHTHYALYCAHIYRQNTCTHFIYLCVCVLFRFFFGSQKKKIENKKNAESKWSKIRSKCKIHDGDDTHTHIHTHTNSDESSHFLIHHITIQFQFFFVLFALQRQHRFFPIIFVLLLDG